MTTSKLSKSPKTIVAQLRARAELLNRRCTINRSQWLLEIAEEIENGKIFTKEYSEEV